MSRALTKLALLASLLAAQAAEAHKLSVRRTLHFEPTADTLHVLGHIVVPSGDSSFALRALADRDHDNQISPEEERGMRAMLTERLLDGLLLGAGRSGAIAWTSTLTLSGIEIDLSLPSDPSRPIELMLHGTAPLSPQIDCLTLESISGDDPLEVELHPGVRPLAATTRGQFKPGPAVVEAALTAHDRIAWRIGRAGSRRIAPSRDPKCPGAPLAPAHKRTE